MIALAITLAAAILTETGVLVWLVYRVVSAQDASADARIESQQRAGELAIAKTDIADWTDKATKQQRRADALDKLVSDLAAHLDVGGARDRVLASWTAANSGPNAAGDNSAGAVPERPAAAQPAPGPDALLKPGE